MVEDIWVHAARRLTSIEFSFDPCNIYRDGPRGVGYPADARSVGDSHLSCWDFGCVECSGHWVDPRNWQTHNSSHGWSTWNHSPLSTSFHCHPAGKCSLFYVHIQIWVRAISNRNCLIFSLRLCASGRKIIIIIIIIITTTRRMATANKTCVSGKN